jgi:hypothetical protein
VETFSADWLALREPADHAARATTVVERAVTALHAAGASVSVPVRVIDLGSGSGSNLRYLAPRLPFPQRWHLLDHDAALLAEARVPLAVDVQNHRVDLRTLPDDVFDGPGPVLVTASALLDLTSTAWLERVAARCRALRAVALFALSYDGRLVCDPADPMDADVRGLVNTHQRSDKGFGPAAGPDATTALATSFARAGHTVHVASSDWDLGNESVELQRQLVGGWAEAAAHSAPERSAAIAAWRKRRIDALAAGASRIRVGHLDVLAYPTPAPPSLPAGGPP